MSGEPLLNDVAKYEKVRTSNNPGTTKSNFLNVISCIKNSFTLLPCSLDLICGDINQRRVNIVSDPMNTIKKIVVAQNWTDSHEETFPSRKTITVIIAKPK